MKNFYINRSEQPVWDSDDGCNYGKYRIPCIIATQKGSLLACCEARQEGGDWDPMDIVLKRSEDGGANWSENIILAKGLCEGVTSGSPVLIADGEIIHLLHCRQTGSAAMGGGVFYRKSTDDGLTWSAPKDISADTYPKDYKRNLLACGPGHGIAHSSGTLICPVWITTGEVGSKAHRPSDVVMLYSLDRGENWNIGEIIYSTEEVPNMSECSAVELSDGRVMLNIRNESPKHRRAFAVSPNGYSHWTKPRHDEALIDPICYGSVARFDENSILFCNAASENNRENISLRQSFDDGKTWQDPITIDPGSAQYADITVTDDSIYILYEKNPNIWLAKLKKQ